MTVMHQLDKKYNCVRSLVRDMEFKVKAIARTSEVTESLSDESLHVLGGKMAGICYMPEDYFDSKIQNEELAIKRANMTSGSGHHSVFDHGSITFQISGLPKILAMLLNSTEQYTTSEKSARYTIMKPETDLEIEVYNKWTNIFNKEIADKYPEIDEKTRNKLSIENARYLISVFTPTHMAWTVTYRQLAYVIGWLDKLSMDCAKCPGEFNFRLSSWCLRLAEAFREETSAHEYIKDNKQREFEFMPFQSYGLHINDIEEIGEVYQITYLASFAQLAQLQRHRTIHYEMDFSGASANEYGVYIPPIIRGTELEVEWVSDFQRVAYCYPQGTLVKVLEQGRAVKFFEKCKERLCGRAQLEIAQNSADWMQKFLDADRSKFSAKTQLLMDKVAPNNTVVTKCCMDGIQCREVCIWKAKQGLYRQI